MYVDWLYTLVRRRSAIVADDNENGDEDATKGGTHSTAEWKTAWNGPLDVSCRSHLAHSIPKSCFVADQAANRNLLRQLPEIRGCPVQPFFCEAYLYTSAVVVVD